MTAKGAGASGVSVATGRTSSDGGSAVPVIRQVRARAHRSPGRTAVEDGTTRLTYGQLWRAAGDLALRLGSAEPPDVPIGILLPRSAELIAAVVASHRAGRAYLPMDPTLPLARIRKILHLAGVRTVFVGKDAGLTQALSAHVRVISVDSPSGSQGLPTDADTDPATADDDLAYVIYTSGSAGEPKGVMIDQHNLGYLVAVDHRLFDRNHTDRVALTASPGFDASVWEIWPTLAAGASLTVVPQDVLLDPPRLQRFLLERAISVSFVPTVLAERLMGLPWPRDDCPLRLLLTGGDRLVRRPSPDLPFLVVNNYGPTEATVLVTSGPVTPHGDGAPSIGHPIPGSRVYLLDEDLNAVTAGHTGELFLSGPGVGRGYLGGLELSAERFLPDPFCGIPGSVMYRTGDLGRWAEHGLEFVGRVDDQVQIRGQRIEPGEVAAELVRQPGVAAAHVLVGGGDQPDDTHLVAYVVGATTSPDPTDLRRRLVEVLPGSWLPRHIIPIEQIPLTPNGKVDVTALRAVRHPSATTTAAPTPTPSDPTEQLVAACWSEVLGIQQVDPDLGFFEAGGHSLQLAEVQAQLMARLGVDLPLTALFEHATIRALTTHLRERSDLRVAPPPAPAQAVAWGTATESLARHNRSRKARAARLRQARAEQQDPEDA
jgi:amino acid adenylation domain-containing protein